MDTAAGEAPFGTAVGLPLVVDEAEAADPVEVGAGRSFGGIPFRPGFDDALEDAAERIVRVVETELAGSEGSTGEVFNVGDVAKYPNLSKESLRQLRPQF